MKKCQAVLNLCGADTKNVNTHRAITPKVGKPELRFMCSAYCLMVFNICVKVYKYVKRFQTYGVGMKIVTVHVFCMSSHGLTFV